MEELTFREIRLHRLIVDCIIAANWEISCLNEIKKDVLNMAKKHRVARVEAQRCLNNAEHKLARATKLLKVFEQTNKETTSARTAWEDSLNQLAKIKRWYE